MRGTFDANEIKVGYQQKFSEFVKYPFNRQFFFLQYPKLLIIITVVFILITIFCQFQNSSISARIKDEDSCSSDDLSGRGFVR